VKRRDCITKATIIQLYMDGATRETLVEEFCMGMETLRHLVMPVKRGHRYPRPYRKEFHELSEGQKRWRRRRRRRGAQLSTDDVVSVDQSK
jgi:hypothetical protein